MCKTKICTKCNEEKESSEFHFRNDTNKYTSRCKVCKREDDNEYRQRNLEIVRERDRQRYIKDYDKRKECSKNTRIKNIDNVRGKDKARYVNERGHRIEYAKQYYQENKERRNELARLNYHSSPEKQLHNSIRTAINSINKKKGFSKKSRTYRIVGCQFDFLRQHIETQFEEGMSWDNRSEWHIDHVLPISLANSEEDVIRLNHWTNLRPLWAFDNISKGNKLPPPETINIVEMMHECAKLV